MNFVRISDGKLLILPIPMYEFKISKKITSSLLISDANDTNFILLCAGFPNFGIPTMRISNEVKMKEIKI